MRSSRTKGNRPSSRRIQDDHSRLVAIEHRAPDIFHAIELQRGEQGAHLFPQTYAAPLLLQHSLKQAASQLLCLVDQESQHHEERKHHREMLVSMPEVVLERIALILERIEGFILHLPACPPAAHDGVDILFRDRQIRHPGEVARFLGADLPVLYEVAKGRK